MKITPLLTVCHLLPLSLSLGAESYANLTESTIVETIKQVDILSGEELAPQPAEHGDLFKFPDFLQTGRGARARLEAKDGTITRVGSNTLFSFEGDQRTINLNRGSLLFHSPEGRGGGRIVTASATASVVGTTIIVAATANGGFKVLVLEGVAQVTYPDNTTRFLQAGQMTFVVPPNADSPDRSGKGPVLNFDLEALSEGSKLVKGFDSPLPSEGKIDFAITNQNQEIEDGELRKTNTFILQSDGDDVIGLDLNNLNELTEAAQESRRAANLLQQLEANGNNPSSGSDSTATEEVVAPATGNSELTRLLAAAGSTVTVTDSFPSENFFDWPGVTVPDGTFEKQPEDNQVMGFITGTLLFPGSSLDVEPITIYPTAADPLVIIFSLNAMEIGGDLTFGGLASDTQFSLESEGSLTIAGESLLEIPGSDSNQSPSQDISNDLNQTSITSTNTGPVDWTISAADSLDLNNVSILNNTTEGNLQVESREGNLTVIDSTVYADGGARLLSSNIVSLSGSDIQADYIEIIGAKEVNISETAFTASYLQIESFEKLMVSNATFSGLDQIRMSAATIALENVDFPTSASQIQLQSANGMLAPNPNTGAAVQLNYVNFVSNVTLGGSPAQNFVPESVGGSSSSSSTDLIKILGPALP